MVPSLALGGAYLLTLQEIPRWGRVAVFGLIMTGFIWAYLFFPNLLSFE
jgi:hypothetical protein